MPEVDRCNVTFEPGDIAACFGTDWTSRLVSCATASLTGPAGLRLGPSHLALICDIDGEAIWTESTTLCSKPCVIKQRCVAGAQAHRPIDRLQDYLDTGGRVDLYRLTEINRLSHDESQLLTRILLNRFIRPGIRYDLAGAMLSGTRVFQLSRLFPGANLDQIFCSELVAAVVMRLNRMNHANPTRFNPARLIRQLIRTGKYHRVHRFQSTP